MAHLPKYFRRRRKTAYLCRENGASEIIVLHCVTAYSDVPNLAHMNLATIEDIRTSFDVEAGFSDNNAGILAPIFAAVAHKAVVIEKHFILSRADGGPDANFSLEPREFKSLVQSVRNAEKTIGKPFYEPGTKESENVIFRKSLFVIHNIKQGEKFTKDNVRSIRPGYGIHPKYFQKIIGKTAKTDLERGTPLKTGHVVKSI